MGWNYLDSGMRTAAENMALDGALLSACETENEPLLHLYDWQQDSATYGHFIDPYKLLRQEKVEEAGLVLAKRPTGGGIIFHTCDLAFSVCVPAKSDYYSINPLENYALINRRVIWAIQKMMGISGELLSQDPKIADVDSSKFCMAKPTKYDVMVGGKKVGGAAQRNKRFGFLHQGSISLGLLPKEQFEDFFIGDDVYANMKKNTFPLLGDAWTQKDLLDARAALKASLIEAFSDEYPGD